MHIYSSTFAIRRDRQFNSDFPSFYIGDGWIASSMAAHHSTIFCY